VTLLMQPEIGEAFEAVVDGRGGSSSMPHKRNPAGCLLALEAAQRAPALAATLLAQLGPEHERGIGHWQSQWLTLHELVGAAASGVVAMAEVLEGLRLDADAMRVNLERSRGLVYSEAVSVRLSRTLGKAVAHALTEQLCQSAVQSGATLKQTLAAHPQAAAAIGVENIDELFVPENCFGSARLMIERALADWESLKAAGGAGAARGGPCG